jgi:N-acetylglucosaminyldiphosphoundecaprenol N-acetyl-beta-D-mannosaminyltransferase
MQRVSLLGVPVDPVTAGESLRRLHDFLEGERQHHVMTPNAEMLVHAARHPSFASLLRTTDLNLPDSAGLLWAARWTGQSIPERVTGADTVERLCASLREDQPVFLLGGKPGVAEKAGLILRSRNPKLRIAGTYAGSPRPEDAEEILRRIREASPRVLFVAYGAPAQDEWINAHLSSIPSVRLAMGVGGTFDFLAGIRTRAPLWMRTAHLEWAWRLLLEPSRWRRILNAVVVFPWLVVRYGKEAAR